MVPRVEFALWSAIIGLLLVLVALSDSWLARLPLSAAMLYGLVGMAVSPLWLDLAALRPMSSAGLLEHLAEIVVLLSLFTSGLKMSLGLRDGRWRPPLRLAVLSMGVTVGAVAAVGVWWLGLPLGAAVLLGAILAPTDPVLASQVQLSDADDRDRLRFALTGEAGLNDGTAFPFVMLGLGLLGLHEIGTDGWRWLAVDVVWATAAGLAIGAALGTGIGHVVLYMRRHHHEGLGLDNFLALGLIALAYGCALLAHGYGFLAVFAAGFALRRVEQRETHAAAGTSRLEDGVAAPNAAALAATIHPDAERRRRVAVDPQHAPAFMAHAVLSFNEQLERVGEVVGVIVIGMLLWAVEWERARWDFVVLLLLFIRPLSTAIGLAGSQTSRTQRVLIGWFGIRGIGSLYYLMYAIGQGIDPIVAETLIALTLSVVVVSMTLHGTSVTPLMALYRRRPRRERL
jgi:NhaP-type Na+/H+ or K+/H+ antiporter